MLSSDATHNSSQSTIQKSQRILVVEDEELIREMIVLALHEEGYAVTAVPDGSIALTVIHDPATKSEDLPFDLVILDIMLPQINGLDLCRLLRYQGHRVPILILSAKGSETDRVLGLEVGADDYLTKPFSTRELVARCRALFRRHHLNYAVSEPPMLQFGEISLYPQQCRVLVREKEVNLAPKEFRLLELFMSSPRRVWSREQLLDKIWGIDFVGDSKTVDVHIRWLREKLEKDPSSPEYIITVRGFGYRLG